MLQSSLLFLLLTFVPQGLDAPDVDGEFSALCDKIYRLEQFLKTNKTHPKADSKRLELADLCFEAGRLLIERKFDENDATGKKLQATEVNRFFKTCTASYQQVEDSLYLQIDEYRKKGKHEKAASLLADSARLTLKRGICHYFWKDHFRFKKEPGTKQAHRDPKQYKLGWSLQLVHYATWDSPPDSHLVLWSWVYAYLCCKELGLEHETDAIIRAVTDEDRCLLELTKTLRARSDAQWLVTDPLEALFSLIVSTHNAEGNPAQALKAAEILFKAYRGAKVKAGPTADLLRLEYYKAALEQRGIGKAGKILLEVAAQNRGNRINRLARPLLEDLVTRCSGKDKKRYAAVLQEARCALAHEYRLGGDDARAIEHYDLFLAPETPERLLKKLGADAWQGKGFCLFQMKKWADAAAAFEKSFEYEGKRGGADERAGRAYWHRALLRAVEASGKNAAASRRLQAAEEKLRELRIEPKAPLPEFGAPIPCRDVSIPPTGIFTRQRIAREPKVFFRSIPVFKPSKKDDKVIWKSVETGLDWLARHQDPEGFWDCDAFGAQCERGKCSGKGNPLNDVGVTGLAVLAFLGADNTLTSGPYCDAVRRGCGFLCTVIDPENGCLTLEEGVHFMYNHAIGSLALTKAYGASSWPALATPAERVLAYIHGSKNPGKAWRYNLDDPREEKQNDVSVTGWMVRCLVSAHACGLTCYEKDIRDALAYIDDMTDSTTGRTGYNECGHGGSREAGDQNTWPFDETEAMTAVAMVCRSLAGQVLDNLESQGLHIDAGAKLLCQQMPGKEENRNRVDYYYWYYGSRAMARVGGTRWKKWKTAVSGLLLDHQDSSKCAEGSWDPRRDPWGDRGSRIYTTALNTLTLQALARRAEAEKGR